MLPAEENATISGLCDAFVEAKRHMLECEELSLQSFQEYEESAAGIVGYFGRDRTLASLAPADFDNFRAKLSGGSHESDHVLNIAYHALTDGRYELKCSDEAYLVALGTTRPNSN